MARQQSREEGSSVSISQNPKMNGLSDNSTHPLPTEESPLLSAHANDELIPEEIDTGEYNASFSWRSLWKYCGPGFLASIAYLDPGNIESDLQLAAVSGNKLLWLLLYAHIGGLIFQVLAIRLGVVTSRHLAQSINEHYPLWASKIIWFSTELAIIGADIQEIIGTAIAIKLFFGWPLWAGTILTVIDTFTFMLLQQYGVRKLEAFFMALIAIMASCFVVEMFLTGADAVDVLHGIAVPQVPKDAVVQAVGLIGAVVMPHNQYLHSAIVKTRRIPRTTNKIKEANFYFVLESAFALLLSYIINLAIVVVFASAFYTQRPQRVNNDLPGLYDAAAVLEQNLGKVGRYLWAAGLLASGQSSTMAGTFAGQYVMEGFWGSIFRKMWHRVALTRSIALVPSLLVALLASSEFDNMGELLNILQSICLPFAIIPILRITANRKIMGQKFVTGRIYLLVCWLLALTVVGFNLYLIATYVEGLPLHWLWISLTILYVIFVIYLVFVTLQRTNDAEAVINP